QAETPAAFLRFPPTASCYWEVEPDKNFVLAAYQAEGSPPALLERKFNREKVRGRVFLFTTAFDTALTEQWNDYLKTEFYFTLAKKAVGYLSGDAMDANFNHLLRPQQQVLVPLPPDGAFPIFGLAGPGLVGQAGLVARSVNQNELRLGQAVQPGNYVLIGGDNQWRTGFSMNVPPEESNLTQLPVA